MRRMSKYERDSIIEGITEWNKSFLSNTIKDIEKLQKMKSQELRDLYQECHKKVEQVQKLAYAKLQEQIKNEVTPFVEKLGMSYEEWENMDVEKVYEMSSKFTDEQKEIAKQMYELDIIYFSFNQDTTYTIDGDFSGGFSKKGMWR